MKRTEEMINLGPINWVLRYDKITAQMKNNNYVMPPELLNDKQFFFHILEQEDANILSAFFEADKENAAGIKTIIKRTDYQYQACKLATENPNHKIMELLLYYIGEEKALQESIFNRHC